MKDNISNILPDLSVGNLLDAVPHGIGVVDRQLRLIAMNRQLEVQTGYSLAEARGVEVDLLLQSSLAGGRVLREVLANGERVIVDGDIIDRHRKKIPIQFTLTPLRNRHKVVVGMMLVLDGMAPAAAMPPPLADQLEIAGIVGRCRRMQEVFALVPLLARTDGTVLVTGETGTGKDLIAEVIHQHSPRRLKPFIKVNCGALPEDLLESELFGHVQGAFTGAVRDKAGMFQLADGGTLFLTEIGDMPIPLQVKLLSVLDDRSFYAVGGERRISVDVRIIAATHHSLAEQVRSGRFREDLYYRVNVLQLHLPPLRERDTDLIFLLHHYLQQTARRYQRPVEAFTPAALASLKQYHYPGNIRELRNIIEYAVCISRTTVVDLDDLPRYLLEPRSTPDSRWGMAEARLPESAGDPRSGTEQNWQDAEKELILAAMIKSRGNRSQAAQLLGWGRTTLWRKLKHHGLVAAGDDRPGSAGSGQPA